MSKVYYTGRRLFDGRRCLEDFAMLTEEGRILAVGIAYDKDDRTKRHECKVEVLREKLK